MRYRNWIASGLSAALLTALGAVAGCWQGWDPTPLFTGTLPAPGLVVNVADAQGNPIVGADVIATDGPYKTWLLDILISGQYRGVYKAGVYTITINAAGYDEYSAEGVVVTSSEVDGSVEPNRVDLNVVLEPTG